MNSINSKKALFGAGRALAVAIALGAGVQGVAWAADGSVYYNNGGVQGEATGLIWDDVNNRTDLLGNRMTFNSADKASGAAHPGPSVWSTPGESGRVNLGWGPGGGANMEMYSKGHTGGSQGQFKFVYGGQANLGKLTFTHYNGTTWVNNMALDANGNLYTRGVVNAPEILVQSSVAWPDYVFEENYPLMPLEDLDQFIKAKGHLPGVATQAEVAEKGVNVGEVSAQLLRKVEELTLYVIDLKKQNDQLSAKVSEMEGRGLD
jgi:hypothetical protein